MDSVNTGANWCEWVQACYGGDAKKVVRDTIRNRHRHDNSFMVYYDRALALVRAEIDGQKTGTEFGSWF